MKHKCQYCGNGCYCKCGDKNTCTYPYNKGICRKCRLND